MSTYKITQILERLVYLEDSNASLRTKVALLEDRLESLTNNYEAELALSTRDNAQTAMLLLPVTGDHDIKRPSPHGKPEGWNQSMKCFKGVLAAHFTGGNLVKAKLVYKAVGKLTRELVHYSFSKYSGRNIAILSWGSLADDQKTIMSSSLKENAALKNIALHRFKNSWEALLILSHKWRTAKYHGRSY
ncbi:hypothetical protein PHYBLDRAFT_169879 [Phycomyces blakesleeanus NRRL 1555(-)]|uniref:Uncharacterized protein n=1 Tax=Phycomyces blakesleeanus (strain ATCC 8743b / DSM 1359 / FGSC 10004 / NBRC 33097 / NRRL 1555) TaxID=763407 RepID=A0A167M6S0_PHYB8|nr:hypothetical protein PHYBLDRAFT_169879 [Phycomyces blakesleeanus NRRL 1555(-)]OAD71969.1 hypothetical protein PHYBLDRAFT_169879 [Phycomyces blakesleeanus NRRL 1555(-)]|eukprot:XP_018290009.1 hypothetical protein PHYBLDRAFT_169879 [Phycomyces blakesleeanus NRRL 1555(-)]